MDEMDGATELSTKEAAAYLSKHTMVEISTEFMYSIKSTGHGPVVEKRGRRLVYRKDALDAFLTENGPNPLNWIAGWSRDVVDQLRAAFGYEDKQVEAIVLRLDPLRDDRWDPDAAKN